MSNIEPTEEQWQAARDSYDGPDADSMTVALARLLAEREAKLQARIDDLTEELAATDTTEMRLRSEVDTLRARVAELEAERGDTVGCEGCGKRLPYACAIPTEDPVYLCARCVSPMPRRRRLATEGRCAMSEPVIKATGARWCPVCRYASDGNRYGAPWMHCSFCDVDTVELYTRDDLVRVAEASRQMAWVQVYNELKSPTIVFEETPSEVVDRLTKGET